MKFREEAIEGEGTNLSDEEGASQEGREEKKEQREGRGAGRGDAALADSLLIKPSPILAIHILLWRSLLALWTSGSAYLKMVRSII